MHARRCSRRLQSRQRSGASPTTSGCRSTLTWRGFLVVLQCQWQGSTTKKPRQVSVLLHPLVVGEAPLLWRDWSRREHRRACIQLVRHQYVKVEVEYPISGSLTVTSVPLSRAERAHYRLSWETRLARNARLDTSERVKI